MCSQGSYAAFLQMPEYRGSAVRIRHNSHYRIYLRDIKSECLCCDLLIQPWAMGAYCMVYLRLFACGKKAYFYCRNKNKRGIKNEKTLINHPFCTDDVFSGGLFR